MQQLLKELRADLKNNADAATRETFTRFFKEDIVCYGIKSAALQRIAKQYWKKISAWDKKDVFNLCEELYKSDYCEEAFIVSSLVPKLSDSFVRSDLAIFKKWIDKYINNWAKCDGFCNHSMGDYIQKFEEDLAELKTWTRSKNRWLKRAAAVSLILPARRGKYLADVFEIADSLLLDPDDMVQKGYGWLLKETSRLHCREVFDYVVKHKETMPRTALRYAIELMPKDLKAAAMKRG